MCGRFSLGATDAEILAEFKAKREKQAEEHQKRYNIAPSQIIAAVRQFESARILSGLKWGLVPSWAKEESIGNKMINARAESSLRPNFSESSFSP